MEDCELISLYLNGDISAFNALVRRHQKPVYNYLLKLVGNREDAADLCQNVFLRCFKSLQKLRSADKFCPWLYSIALNLSRDHWRSQKGMLSLDDDSEEGNHFHELPSAQPDPACLAETDNRADMVRKALMLIPFEQREVLILKVYQGMKFTEIAQIVGAPLNTVKSRLYYGLSAMKKIFLDWKLEELEHYEM
jgi:RNA polymerase sigma-70 factor (ECF subfamily)